MKRKRIFCAILVCVLIVTQLASLGAVSLAAAGPSDGDFEVTLTNGAVVRTDDFDKAVETLNYYGVSLKLYTDVDIGQAAHIQYPCVIDLNGHTMSDGDIYFYDEAFTVTDSSVGGALRNIDMSTTGELTLDGIAFDGELSAERFGAIIMDGVRSGELRLELYGDDSRVSIDDTVFDSLYIYFDGSPNVRMNGMTVNEELTLDGHTLAEFFGDACTSVSDGSGQAVVFEQDAHIYRGALKVSHNDSKIDKTVWKHSNIGHFHLCECGHKADFEEHTSRSEKCSVCNAEPYISVTKNGETEYFFDALDMEMAIGEEGQAAVRLYGDVKSADSIYISGDVSVTLDLAGFDLDCYLLYIYGNAEFTVTDTSAEKDGRVIVRNEIFLDGNALFRLVDGGIDGELAVYGSGIAELSGGRSGRVELNTSSDGRIIISGGSFERLYLYSDPQNTFVTGAKVTDRLVAEWRELREYLDHSCISVNTGTGPSYDPYAIKYECEGNTLVISHNASGFSQTPTGLGIAHGNTCAECGASKNIARCSGGSATCTAPASCQVCSEPYGEKLPHTIGADGKCTVCPTEASIVVTGDAKTLYFFDLEDAFDEAGKLTSAVITLRDDVICDDEIDAYGSILLNMGVYDLFVDELNIYGSLVIDDEEGFGCFVTDSVIDINKNATLTVEGGDFEESTAYFDLWSEGSKLFINGGSFSDVNIYLSGKDALAVVSDIETDHMFCSANRGNFVINGGTFYNAPTLIKNGIDRFINVLDKPCITLYDESGEEIAADEYYGGELTVEHNDQYQGVGYTCYANGHRTACTCGEPIGTEILPHQGGSPTCESGRICTDCGAEYGAKAPHSFVGGKCSACGGRENLRVDAEGFSQSFCDLEEALMAAGGLQNATVTLLQSYADEYDLMLEIPVSVTLDLAGNTLCSRYIILEATSLTVRDSSENKNGSLLGGFLEVNEGNALTVESGNIYHILYGYGNSSITVSGGNCFGGIYSYNNGRVVISGGYIGVKAGYSDDVRICVDDNSTVSISGGVFDIYEIDIDDDTALELSGGLFKGKALIIEYDGNARASVSGGAFENGIVLELDEGEGQRTLADIVSGAGCVAFIDGSGNKVDMTAQRHDGYIVASNVCSYALKSDESGHWYECSVCADRKPSEAHADADGDEVCDICSFDLDGGGLGVGAIVGIVLGSVAVAGIGGFAIFWFVIKKKSIADLVAVFKK